MTIQDHIQHWLNTASNDLQTAEMLLQSGRYDWALFIGHLVLEKTIKALYVKKNDNKMPPKIHSLVRLAELSSLNIEGDIKESLDKINDFNLETRYPEYKNEFYKLCTKEFAEQNFNKIKELRNWLLSQII